MLDAIQKRKDSGFTIVEVMIVLAIAGLIILVVFLAVPALQRNSRNTQRNSDAGLVGGAINECLSNRNGQSTSCDQLASGELNDYIDITKLRQFTTVTVTTATTAPVNVGAPASGNLDTINVSFGRKCEGTGATPVAGPARAAALLYNTENQSGNTVTRCQEI